MIFSRAKSVNLILPIPLPHFANQSPSQPFCALHTNNPRHKTRHDQPRSRRATSKIRKRMPFISEVKEVQDPEDALSLFNYYKKQGFNRDYPSCAALLYKLARSRNFEAVETVLNHMQDRNIHCREAIFVALIQHFGKSLLSEKAIRLFQRMSQFNCARTLQSFNALLNVLVDNGLFSEANDTFSRSYEMGFRPNTVSFNIMIKGWLAKDEWGRACEVFDKMLEKKVQPSVVTYNSLIGFLSRKGDLSKAMALLDDMKQKGKYPNEVTYALLMEGLCSVDKYEEAKKLMFDMAYRGCKPRVVNFAVLMTDLGKRGKIEEAKSLLNDMKKRRFKPDVVTYNILINFLCKGNKTEEAYKVLIEMQIGGCEPNAATYRMMVDGFCQTGNFEAGLNVLSAMLTSNHCPRLETFNCLVVGLLKSRIIEGACFVLEEMEKRKVQLGLESWETVVKYACVENKDWCRVEGFPLATHLVTNVKARIKVHKLRNKSKQEFLNQLKDLKVQLAFLSIAKVTGVDPNKLSKIKVAQHQIGQVLMVIFQKQKVALRDAYENKKYLHFDLRPKEDQSYLKVPHKAPGFRSEFTLGQSSYS